MEFEILRAEEADVPAIYELMKAGKAGCSDAEWYSIDDVDYVRKHVDAESETGFVLKARKREDGSALTTGKELAVDVIAGFLLVHFPGTSSDNMARYMNLAQSEYDHVTYMDSAAVDPKFRGNHLQQRLILQAEEELKGTPYYHLMCTVHPENQYSLNNMKKLGYQVVAKDRMYGGLPRLVLYKRLQYPYITSPSTSNTK